MDSVHHSDALDLCNGLEPQSVDMILADLPYGTTACSWDEIIPFAPMWAAFKRVIKPRGAIVLTASQPFTSKLVCSNLEMFRHEWVWNKVKPGNVFIGEHSPLRNHESVLVFSIGSVKYYPIMTHQIERAYKAYSPTSIIGNGLKQIDYMRSELYPKSIITFSNADNSRKFHPTQKPTDLFAYLIRTYTQPGALVLDPTCGSGTTAIAARQTGRHYIVGDSAAEYVAVTRQRLAQPYTLPLPLEDVPQARPTQLGLAI